MESKSVGNSKKVSWSVSITAAIGLLFAAAVYSADGRYVLAGDFKRGIEKALINHELMKLRVEISVLTERRNTKNISMKEKTDLDIKEAYRRDLTDQLRNIGGW